MNVLCIRSLDPSMKKERRVYYQLKNLICCIMSPDEIDDFSINEKEIYNTISNLTNWDKDYLFDAMFMFYIVSESMTNKAIYEDKEPIWKDCLKMMKSITDENVYIRTFYYSGLVDYYGMNNRSFYRIPGCYSGYHMSYEEAFKEYIQESDESVRDILERYYQYREFLFDKYHNSEVNIAIFEILGLITSYCIVTGEFNIYDDLVNNLLNSSNVICERIELNGLLENIFSLRTKFDNPDIEKTVKYVIDLVSTKEKGNAIR